MSWRGGYDFIRLRTAPMEWRSQRWQWRDPNWSKWWSWWPRYHDASNENSVIIIEIIFYTDTCLSKMFSIMPRHNYLSRLEARPNCERRCSIRHSSIEGNQLGKCFHKTPLRPPETPVLMSFLWLSPNFAESHNTWWTTTLLDYWFNINTFNTQSVTFLSNKQHIIDFIARTGPGWVYPPPIRVIGHGYSGLLFAFGGE